MEAKEILEILSIEAKDDLTVEKVREQLNTKYILRDIAHEDSDINGKVMGKANGVLRTKIAQNFGMKHNDIKDTDVADLLDQVKTTNESSLKDLQDQLKSSSDENVKKLQTKVDKLTTDRDTFKTELTKVTGEFETAKLDFETQGATLKIDFEVGKLKAGIPMVDDITNDQKNYFDWAIGENYNFEFGEDGKLEVRDKAGKPLSDPAKVGHFLDPKTAITNKAKELKFLKLNKAKPQGKWKPGTPPPDGSDKRLSSAYEKRKAQARTSA